MFFKKKNELATVKLNELANVDEINELALVEIKDEKVINRIISAVPEAAKFVGNALTAAETIGVANGGIFQAILPSGAHLVNSTATEGAVREFFQKSGKIAGQAEFMSVEGTMEKIAAMNIANVAMGAASLVVGQYYMKQINKELGEISDGISKIQDFQQNEYRSKVITLLTQVKRAADFQTEILEDSSLRTEEINRLQDLESTCMQLLNQANGVIEQCGSRQYDTFEKYSEVTTSISEWQKYQTLLINVLFTIADLNYTFHLGAMSPEQCYRAYEDTFRYTKSTIDRIKQWHLTHEKTLGIDINQAIVERKGFDAILHKPLTIFDESFQYKTITKKEVENIRVQIGTEVFDRREDNKNLYMEDTRIIIKEGKIYYLSA